MLLSPPNENNLPMLLMGLKRLNFGIKALGVKTKPVWAMLASIDTPQAAHIAGIVHRATREAVSRSRGVTDEISPELA